MPMVPSSEEGYVRIGNCPGGRLRHVWTNAAISEAINTDRESSSTNALPTAQRAWANTPTTCVPDEPFVAVAERTIAAAECNAAGDTIAASDAFQGAGSEYQRNACIQRTDSRSQSNAPSFDDGPDDWSHGPTNA